MLRHEMERFEPFVGLGLALLLGLLIGFEREQSAPDDTETKRHNFVGGARTHPLVAIIGALSMLLVPALGVGVVLVAFVVVVAFLALAYVDELRRQGDRGLTSESAFLITFLLGALSTSSGVLEPVEHRVVVLSATAVIVAVLLSIKPRIHAIAAKASKDDIYATLKFLIVAVVVLPLLPREDLGPFGALNPFKIGLLVVLIAGIDFVGYVAVRVLGAGRGLGLTGVVGGLASSTAVTLSMAGRAKQDSSLAASCALATVTASTVMAPRVLIEVSVVNRDLVAPLLWPLLSMTAGGVVAIAYFYRRSRQEAAKGTDLELQNPFELSSALKWGLVFVVVLFSARLATEYLGTRGTYLAGLLAGTTDVDAITLSMASLAKDGQVPSRVAVTTIMIGAASNTVVKGVMATVIAGRAYGRLVGVGFGAMLLAGAGGLALLWLR